MKENYKTTDIIIYRGDVFEYYFKINHVAPQYIKKVMFLSDKGKLYVELPYYEKQGGYCLRLGSDITKNFEPVIASYDLTVEYVNEQKETLISDGLFAILKNRNGNY